VGPVQQSAAAVDGGRARAGCRRQPADQLQIGFVYTRGDVQPALLVVVVVVSPDPPAEVQAASSRTRTTAIG